MTAEEMDWEGAHPALIEVARHIPISPSNMRQFVIPRIAGTADILDPIATVQLALAAVDSINKEYFRFEATAEGAAARSVTHEWLATRLEPKGRSVSTEVLRNAENAAVSVVDALQTLPAKVAVGATIVALRTALAADAGDDALAIQHAVDAVALALEASRTYYQAVAPKSALDVTAQERPRGPFGSAQRRAELEKQFVHDAALSTTRAMLNDMLKSVGLQEAGYALNKQDARRHERADRRNRKLGDRYGYCPKCRRGQTKVSRSKGKCWYDGESLPPITT